MHRKLLIPYTVRGTNVVQTITQLVRSLLITSVPQKSLLFRDEGTDIRPLQPLAAGFSTHEPRPTAFGLQSGAMKTLHRFSMVLLVAGAIAGFLTHPLHAVTPPATPPSGEAPTKEEQAVM